MKHLIIEFEIWCSCGEGLCRQSSLKDTSFTIEPCESCLKKAREEGFEEGKNADKV